MKKTSINKKIISLKSEIFKNLKNLDSYITRIKSKYPYNLKKQILSEISQKKFPGFQYVYEGLLPKSISEIETTKYIPFFEDGQLIKDIEWISIIIEQYHEKLQYYINLKGKYETSLILDDLSNADIILNKIKKEIAFSLWGIEQSFILSELQGGFEDNKKLLSVIGKESKNYLTLVTTDFLSYRAEIETSYTSLLYRLKHFYDEGNNDFASRLFKSYLDFKLRLVDEDYDEENLRHVISVESMMSIIDIYETTIRICQMIISSEKYLDDEKLYLIRILKNINRYINDDRIDALLILYFEEELNYNNFTKEQYIVFSKVINLYTVGEYKECINLIEDNLNILCNIFESLEILVKSCIHLNMKIEDLNVKSSLILKLIHLMYNIYICNDKLNNIKKIINIGKIFSSTSFRYKIIDFASRHLLNSDFSNYFKRLSSINSLLLTPKFTLLYKDNNKREQFLEQLIKHELFENSVELFKSYFNNNSYDIDKISHERLSFYEAKALSHCNEFDAIYKFEEQLRGIAKQINTSYGLFYYERVATQLFNAYIEKEKFFEAIRLIVDSFLFNSSLILRMDKNLLFNKIKNIQNKHIVKNIRTPIFHYLLDDKNYTNIYIALANFLESNDMRLPSDLISWVQKNEKYKNEVTFILYNIYVKEIMKRFVELNPSKRIDERLRTLEYLIEIDSKNKKMYLDEINSILKEQSIKDKIKSIDEKKIFVDTKGIFNEFDDIFRDKYRRYIALKELKLDLKYYDIGLKQIEKQFFGGVLEELNHNHEKKQRYILFKEIINDFKNEFLFNSKYGLDKFLSSRIRHGILESNLSKTFKNQNLLSSKIDESSKDYNINRYWDLLIEDRIDQDNSRDFEMLKNILSGFSNKIIGKIDEVKSWIRIKDKGFEDGMFDYSDLLTEHNILFLYTNLQNIVEYENLYDEITNTFWAFTEINLNEIRNRIMNELYQSFISYLDKLEMEIDLLKTSKVPKSILSELSNKINICKSMVRNDLEAITKWFHIRKENEYYDYPINELIRTCIEINSKVDRNYSLINLKEDVKKDIILKGSTFSYFIDIVNNLYSNAITHSGFDRYEDIEIEIIVDILSKKQGLQIIDSYSKLSSDYRKIRDSFLKSSAPILKLSVKNKLSSNVDLNILKEKIITVYENLNDFEKYKEMVTNEGGTGLYKINNIIKYNIYSPYLYSFNVKDRYFIAEIYLDLNKIVSDEEAQVNEYFIS